MKRSLLLAAVLADVTSFLTQQLKTVWSRAGFDHINLFCRTTSEDSAARVEGMFYRQVVPTGRLVISVLCALHLLLASFSFFSFLFCFSVEKTALGHCYWFAGFSKYHQFCCNKDVSYGVILLKRREAFYVRCIIGLLFLLILSGVRELKLVNFLVSSENIM